MFPTSRISVCRRDDGILHCQRMGIRYFAQSVDQADFEHVKAGPCPTCGSRPHPRDSEPGDPEPFTVSLDKSWSYLQAVFESTGHLAALQLVDGHVTHTYDGWISHQGVIAPEFMPELAADLESVTAEEVRSLFIEGGEWRDERSEGDFDYASHYLAEALEFAKSVSSKGLGVVYYIG